MLLYPSFTALMDCAAVVVTIVFVSLASHLALAEPLLGPSSYLEPQVGLLHNATTQAAFQ